MEIDLGIDFETAEKEVAESRKPVTPGDYTVQVTNITPGQSGSESKTPGRPYLNWELTVVGHSEFTGKKVWMITSLPWADASNGNRLLTSGINFLVDITKALGQPWQGGKLRTEEYHGRTCKATIGLEINKRSGEPRNTIDKVYA